MKAFKVTQLLADGKWAVVTAENEFGPLTLRNRTPVLSPSETGDNT